MNLINAYYSLNEIKIKSMQSTETNFSVEIKTRKTIDIKNNTLISFLIQILRIFIFLQNSKTQSSADLKQKIYFKKIRQKHEAAQVDSANVRLVVCMSGR